MANFYVTNNRFPTNPQLFTVNVTKLSRKGGEVNPNFVPTYPSAEPYWTLLIYTTGKDASGNTVGPVSAGVTGGLDTVEEVVAAKVAELCSLIDWTSQGQYTPQSDVGAPAVVEQFPAAGQTGVGINSSIRIRIQDLLPANGVDISTLSFKVNGISVTPKITGNKYDYTLVYTPRAVYNS